jgi:hypothetical protein
MTVYFYSSGYFFVYGCEGSISKARKEISAKLKLMDPPIASAAERTDEALDIWGETVEAAGTLVETYLQGRGITVPVPERIRFHPKLWHGGSRDAWPAMVALVTNADDEPVAIHRTYLSPWGKGKAPVEPEKMTLGPIGGNAIRLSPAAEHIAIGEGIETCMSAIVAGKAAWSAISAVGMRLLILPEIVREVTILVDGDQAGEAAALEAAGRWLREGRKVLLCRSPPGMDLNDLLMMGGRP